MANRRMFSLDVVDTDKFLDMPISAQCLYFHLGMRADDDGFVASPKQIMRMATCTQGDIKVLAENGFIIPFESGIVVIRHWKQHNYIQSDRYRKTKYVEERDRLELVDNVYRLDTENIQVDCGMDTQYRLSKDRARDSIELGNTISSEPEAVFKSSGIQIPLVDRTNYDVPLDKIEKWAAAYPAVDVEHELRKMIAWCESNPTRKKTRKGVERFINSWLSRQQDSGKGSRIPKQDPAAYETPEYLKNVKAAELTPEEKAMWGGVWEGEGESER